MEMDCRILDEYPHYKIYPDGKVYSIKLKRYINGHKNKRGYYAFSLYDLKGKRRQKGLHQLLAMAFIPNPKNHEVVRHLDDNKDNNSLSNLKWGTIKENVEDAIKNGVYKMPDNSKRWLIKIPSGDIIEVKNLTTFCLENDLNKQTLHKTYNGTRNHHKEHRLLQML